MNLKARCSWIGAATVMVMLMGVTACNEAGSGGGGGEAVTSEHVVILTSDNFQQEVELATQPVVVDFWAAWCGPCRRLSPMLARMADRFHPQVKVGKVNVDEQPQLAERFGIRAIPTVIIFQGGKQVDQIVGLPSENTLQQKFESLGAQAPSAAE